jgi:hypothetical protein
MAAYLQSIEPPTKAMTIRQSAEREVAHALCAQERGFRGRHRRDRRQRGSDPLDAATRRSPIQVAAVIVAPEVWVNVHRSGTFTRGGTGCEQDRRMAAGYVDSDGAGQARQIAHRVLLATRADILALADALEPHDGGCRPLRRMTTSSVPRNGAVDPLRRCARRGRVGGARSSRRRWGARLGHSDPASSAGRTSIATAWDPPTRRQRRLRRRSLPRPPRGPKDTAGLRSLLSGGRERPVLRRQRAARLEHVRGGPPRGTSNRPGQ